MIVSSIRARITRNVPGALEWSHSIAEFVKGKTGNEVEVLSRIGSTQDVVWLQRFPDLSAYEKSQEAIQSDPDYQARIRDAEEQGFFDMPSVEAGIWRAL
jgi:hypothetical protein